MENAKRKIIFLDIDGVLNTMDGIRASMEEYRQTGKGQLVRFDVRAVGNLNSLIEQTGAVIVISSSWRYGLSIDEMQGKLEKHGVRGTVIDLTPSIFPADRHGWQNPGHGAEIAGWLSSQKEEFRYVILDDDETGITEELRKHFVHCRPPDGFANPLTFDAAISILAG